MFIEELTVENLDKVVRESTEIEDYPETSLVMSTTFGKSIESLTIITKALFMTQKGLPTQTALVCLAVAFFRAGMLFANQQNAKTAVN